MVELVKKEYWSKSDAFLLPLTGLSKTDKYKMKSYLFWDEFSIEDYRLVLSFSYKNYNEFIEYCRKTIFPILTKEGYMVENYDFPGESIFILDISQWALDIEMFLSGKYSKLSADAKTLIEQFHVFGNNQIPLHIFGVLYPKVKLKILNNMTPLEYLCEEYGFDCDEIEKMSESGGIYLKENETLSLDVRKMCQNDT